LSGAAHFYLKYNGIYLPYCIFLLTLSRFCTASSCADFTRGLVIVTQCLAKLTRHVAGLTQCLAELTRNVRITEDIIRFLSVKYENKREIAAWERLCKGIKQTIKKEPREPRAPREPRVEKVDEQTFTEE